MKQQCAVELPEFCYALRELEMLDPSIKLVSPIIVKRGESGYYPTDWVWNKETAQEALNAMNAKLGVSPEMVDQMVAQSMWKRAPLPYHQRVKIANHHRE